MLAIISYSGNLPFLLLLLLPVHLIFIKKKSQLHLIMDQKKYASLPVIVTFKK